MKRVEKKLDGNCKQQTVLKESWKQHRTKTQMYGHLPPISKTIQIRRTSVRGTAVEARTNS